jgi:hypothetical protein
VKPTLATTVLAALAALAMMGAGTPMPMATPVTQTKTVETTGKIVAIDHTSRTLTLADAKGNVQTIQVGESVSRFDNLKVGDTITFRYEESVARTIVDEGTKPPTVQAQPTIAKAPGEKPGGSITQTSTTIFKVKAIDQATSSITVVTQDGRTVSMLVQDKDELKGLHVGDTVQVTYTKSLIVTVR